MTIVAAVKSRDGLVLGTDSMTQVVGIDANGNPAFLKAYENATKLFQLGDSPIGIASWGAGNIGPRSIGGLILDYSENMKQPPATVEDAATGLAQFIGQIYDAAFSAVAIGQQPLLGFLLGGYSFGQPLAELWEVRFPFMNQSEDRARLVRGQQDFGANWRGIELPFTRLHMGFDPRILEELIQNGVDRNLLEQTVSKFQAPIVFDSMPVQDAINFSIHILKTTISFSTFEIGVPSCGEPLQVAVILRKKRFVWVEEPRFHV